MPRKRRPTIDPTRDYTTDEAAGLVGLSISTIQTYCRDGVLAGAKRGRDWFVPGRELIRYEAHITDADRPKVGRPRNREA